MFHVICTSVGGRTQYGLKGACTRIEDITGDESALRSLAGMLNRNEASERHIYELIENWFGQN